MAIVYYDRDADPRALRGKTIAVIGYGSQGHAHAQNLRDSGQEVIVGLQAGSKSWAKAEQDGFTVRETADAARNADVVALLVPDQNHREAYEKVAPFMGKGKTLLVAHAFSVHFGEVKPHAEADVVMIAPKAPGHRMREVFKEGKGVPALLAVYQDVSGKAEQTALAYAQGVGATRAGVIKTTFAEEVETDWFGEQVILCGGISELMKASFDTLVDAGLPARGRVLRVRERDEAHRRPHLRRRALVHALLGVGHRRVRRLHRRPADHRRARARGDEAAC